MHRLSTSSGNHLLASLPAEAKEEILDKLTPVILENRSQLHWAEQPIEHVYFVEAGMISIVCTLENGMQAEVGVVGREGVLGASVLSGIGVAFFDAMVQMPGAALRMSVRDFHNKIETCTPLRRHLLRYNEMLHVQAMQTAACNGHHRLEQRLARWLLVAHDQVDGTELFLTQDFIAMMLGVYRPNVTVIAGNLQRAGLIAYRSGCVTIVDRPGLEVAACECYRASRRRCDLILQH